MPKGYVVGADSPSVENRVDSIERGGDMKALLESSIVRIEDIIISKIASLKKNLTDKDLNKDLKKYIQDSVNILWEAFGKFSEALEKELADVGIERKDVAAADADIPSNEIEKKIQAIFNFYSLETNFIRDELVRGKAVSGRNAAELEGRLSEAQQIIGELQSSTTTSLREIIREKKAAAEKLIKRFEDLNNGIAIENANPLLAKFVSPTKSTMGMQKLPARFSTLFGDAETQGKANSLFAKYMNDLRGGTSATAANAATIATIEGINAFTKLIQEKEELISLLEAVDKRLARVDIKIENIEIENIGIKDPSRVIEVSDFERGQERLKGLVKEYVDEASEASQGGAEKLTKWGAEKLTKLREAIITQQKQELQTSHKQLRTLEAASEKKGVGGAPSAASKANTTPVRRYSASGKKPELGGQVHLCYRKIEKLMPKGALAPASAANTLITLDNTKLNNSGPVELEWLLTYSDFLLQENHARGLFDQLERLMSDKAPRVAPIRRESPLTPRGPAVVPRQKGATARDNPDAQIAALFSAITEVLDLQIKSLEAAGDGRDVEQKKRELQTFLEGFRQRGSANKAPTYEDVQRALEFFSKNQELLRERFLRREEELVKKNKELSEDNSKLLMLRIRHLQDKIADEQHRGSGVVAAQGQDSQQDEFKELSEELTSLDELFSEQPLRAVGAFFGSKTPDVQGAVRRKLPAVPAVPNGASEESLKSKLSILFSDSDDKLTKDEKQKLNAARQKLFDLNLSNAATRQAGGADGVDGDDLLPSKDDKRRALEEMRKEVVEVALARAERRFNELLSARQQSDVLMADELARSKDALAQNKEDLALLQRRLASLQQQLNDSAAAAKPNRVLEESVARLQKEINRLKAAQLIDKGTDLTKSLQISKAMRAVVGQGEATAAETSISQAVALINELGAAIAKKAYNVGAGSQGAVIRDIEIIKKEILQTDLPVSGDAFDEVKNLLRQPEVQQTARKYDPAADSAIHDKLCAKYHEKILAGIGGLKVALTLKIAEEERAQQEASLARNSAASSQTYITGANGGAEESKLAEDQAELEGRLERVYALVELASLELAKLHAQMQILELINGGGQKNFEQVISALKKQHITNLKTLSLLESEQDQNKIAVRTGRAGRNKPSHNDNDNDSESVNSGDDDNEQAISAASDDGDQSRDSDVNEELNSLRQREINEAEALYSAIDLLRIPNSRAIVSSLEELLSGINGRCVVEDEDTEVVDNSAKALLTEARAQLVRALKDNAKSEVPILEAALQVAAQEQLEKILKIQIDKARQVNEMLAAKLPNSRGGGKDVGVQCEDLREASVQNHNAVDDELKRAAVMQELLAARDAASRKEKQDAALLLGKEAELKALALKLKGSEAREKLLEKRVSELTLELGRLRALSAPSEQAAAILSAQDSLAASQKELAAVTQSNLVLTAQLAELREKISGSKKDAGNKGQPVLEPGTRLGDGRANPRSSGGGGRRHSEGGADDDSTSIASGSGIENPYGMNRGDGKSSNYQLSGHLAADRQYTPEELAAIKIQSALRRAKDSAAVNGYGGEESPVTVRRDCPAGPKTVTRPPAKSEPDESKPLVKAAKFVFGGLERDGEASRDNYVRQNNDAKYGMVNAVGNAFAAACAKIELIKKQYLAVNVDAQYMSAQYVLAKFFKETPPTTNPESEEDKIHNSLVLSRAEKMAFLGMMIFPSDYEEGKSFLNNAANRSQITGAALDNVLKDRNLQILFIRAFEEYGGQKTKQFIADPKKWQVKDGGGRVAPNRDNGLGFKDGMPPSVPANTMKPVWKMSLAERLKTIQAGGRA